MEKEAEYLYHLLGAYVRREAPRSAEGMALEKLEHLAYIHSVPGIFGYMAMKHRLFPAVQRSFRSSCMAAISGYAQRASLAEQIFEKLDQLEIDYCLVKGYVLKDCYPVPEFRTFGDIDLVIRPDDREKSHRLMQELGYQIKTDWEPVYSYIGASQCYEFHTELLETDISEGVDCRDYFRDLWSHVTRVGEHRFHPTPEFHFLYMLAHLAKHVASSGAGARMYLDLAAFILHYGGEADWNWIRQELEKIRLAAFANTALTFVERYFGVESPLALTDVDADVLEALAAMTADGGLFGRIGLDLGVNTMQEQGEERSRVQAVVRRLFPAAETISSRYTYLQTKPWLLPVAWVHRMFITRETWADHAREVRSILHADLDEVRAARQFRDAIGLGGIRTRMAEANALLEEYSRMLREDPRIRTLPLVISGYSMAPFLVHGRDTIYLSRLTRPIRRGDAVLYRRDSGQYVFHRVYRVADGTLTMVGDAQTELEYGIRPEQVIAIMTKARRKEKDLTPGSFWWWFFEKIWIRMVPLRPLAHRVYGWLRRR